MTKELEKPTPKRTARRTRQALADTAHNLLGIVRPFAEAAADRQLSASDYPSATKLDLKGQVAQQPDDSQLPGAGELFPSPKDLEF